MSIFIILKRLQVFYICLHPTFLSTNPFVRGGLFGLSRTNAESFRISVVRVPVVVRRNACYFLEDKAEILYVRIA